MNVVSWNEKKILLAIRADIPRQLIPKENHPHPRKVIFMALYIPRNMRRGLAQGK